MHYAIAKFKEQFPLSCDEFNGDQKEQTKFNDKIDGLLTKKGGPDAYAFMDYLTGKELDKYIQEVKPKATKKKPMSIERLNMVIMTILKCFESEIEGAKNQQEKASDALNCLSNWIKTIKEHQNLNVNSQFEALLNIYLVLGTQTAMKSTVFMAMVDFLSKHNQLEAVMIKQVQDVVNLSEQWKLTKEQRFDLYICCAEGLEQAKDSTGAVQVYMEALKLVSSGQKNKQGDQSKKEHTERLIVNAIKSPQTINFEEILLIDAVKQFRN